MVVVCESRWFAHLSELEERVPSFEVAGGIECCGRVLWKRKEEVDTRQSAFSFGQLIDSGEGWTWRKLS